MDGEPRCRGISLEHRLFADQKSGSWELVMPEWEVLSEIFGDEAGPVQVLLVFSDAVSNDDIQSLQHVAPFSFHPGQIYSDEFEDFFRTFCHMFSRTSDISPAPDNLLLVNFKNERHVRSEGAAFLLKLVSNSNLLAAYKMSDADMEEIQEHDRRRNELQSLQNASEKMQRSLRDYAFRKANPPRKYIKNYNEVVETCSFFQYDFDGAPIAFDIDSSMIISVEGRCDHLSKMLTSVLSEERNEILSESAAFLSSLKII